MYSHHIFQLPREFLIEVTQLDPKRSIAALVSTWAVLAILILSFRWMGTPAVFYVPLIFLIAGRFGALLQLIHEGAHGLLARTKAQNDFIARWLCAYAIGIFYDGYVRGHMRHHSSTNTVNDPPADTEKYRLVDFSDPKLYGLFLKDLLGLTAFEVFFAYRGADAKPTETNGISKLKTLASISLCQLVILGALFQFDLKLYLLLWIVPAISPHMFLMRIRGIAEHGLPRQLGVTVTEASQGNFHTRTFGAEQSHYAFAPLRWIERILIGSLEVYHHHEHHLLPTVPFYHLRKVHRRISPEVQRMNPEVYAKGYFSAAFRNLTVGGRELCTSAS